MLFRSSMIIQFREHYFNCLEYLIGKDSIVDEEIKEITEKIIKKYSELNYSYYNRKLDMNRKKLLYIVREEGNIIGKNYPYSYIYGICKAVKILKRFENMDRISLKEIYLDKNLGKEKLTKQEIEETIVYIKNI